MRKSLLGLTVLGLAIGVFGCSRGSRGVEDVYHFKYHGQNAVVKHEDIRLGPDYYWIEIGNDKIIGGRITSDDNKVINLWKTFMDSTLSNSNRYSVKDNH